MTINYPTSKRVVLALTYQELGELLVLRGDHSIALVESDRELRSQRKVLVVIDGPEGYQWSEGMAAPQESQDWLREQGILAKSSGSGWATVEKQSNMIAELQEKLKANSASWAQQSNTIAELQEIVARQQDTISLLGNRIIELLNRLMREVEAAVWTHNQYKDGGKNEGT